MFHKLIIALAPWKAHWSIVFTMITASTLSKILPSSFQGHWYTLIPIIIIFILYFALFSYLFERALVNTPNVTRHQQLVWQAILISAFAVFVIVGLSLALLS
jgi:hypothetical protein